MSDTVKLERKIKRAYVFQNGMTMVFDQFGEQMPEFQGRQEEMVPKIKAAGFQNIEHRTWR